jgi:hypothetical protein
MCLRYIQPQSAANLQLNKFCLWSSRQIIRIAKVPWTPEDFGKNVMHVQFKKHSGSPWYPDSIIFRKHSVRCCQALKWLRADCPDKRTVRLQVLDLPLRIPLVDPTTAGCFGSSHASHATSACILGVGPNPWRNKKASRATHRGSSSHLFQDSVWTWAI